MQFLVIAKDGADADALKRRLAARDEHLQHTDEMIANGNAHMAAALLDDDGQMNGSVMIVEFESEDAFRSWLDKEPYVTGKVWDKISVTPCKIGPSFLDASRKAA